MRKKIILFILLSCLSSNAFAKITTNYSDPSGAETLDMIKNSFNTDTKIYDKLIAPSVTDEKHTTVDGSVSFDADVSCRTEAVFASLTMTPNSYGQIQISGVIDENLDGIQDKTISASNMDVFCSNGAIVNCEKGELGGQCKKCVWVYSGTTVSLQCHIVSSNGDIVDVPTSSLETCTYVSIGSGNAPGALNEQMGKEIALFLVDKAREKIPSISLAKIEYSGSMNQSMKVYAANTASCLSSSEQSDIKSVVDIYNKDPWKLVNPQTHEDEAWSLFNSIAPDYSGTKKCTINNSVITKTVKAKVSKTAFFYIIWDTDGSTKDCVYGSNSGQCKQAVYYGGKRPNAFWQCKSAVLGIQGRICDDVYGQKYEILGYHSPQVAPGYKDPPGSESRIGNKFGSGCNGAHGNDNAPKWQLECEMYDNIDMVVCSSESMGKAGVTLVSDSLPQSVIDSIPGAKQIFSKGTYQSCDVVQKPVSSCTELEADPSCTLTSTTNDGLPAMNNHAVSGGYTDAKICRVVGNFTPTLVCEDWWTQTRTYKCTLGDVYDPTNLKKRTTTIGQGVEQSFSSNKLTTVTDQTFEGGVLAQKSSFPVTVAIDSNTESCVSACVVAKNINTADLMIKPNEGDWKANPDEGIPANTDDFPIAASPHSSIYVETRDCTQEGGLLYTCPVDVAAGEFVRYPCSCSESKEFIEVVSLMQLMRNLNDDVTCSSGTKSQTICDASQDPTVPEYGPVVCSNYTYTSDGSLDPETGERVMSKADIVSCQTHKLVSSSSFPLQRWGIYLDENYICQIDHMNQGSYPISPASKFSQFNSEITPLTSKNGWFDWAEITGKQIALNHAVSIPGRTIEPESGCPCPESNIATSNSIGDTLYKCEFTNLENSASVLYDNVAIDGSSKYPFGSVKIKVSEWGRYDYEASQACSSISTTCSASYEYTSGSSSLVSQVKDATGKVISSSYAYSCPSDTNQFGLGWSISQSSGASAQPPSGNCSRAMYYSPGGQACTSVGGVFKYQNYSCGLTGSTSEVLASCNSICRTNSSCPALKESLYTAGLKLVSTSNVNAEIVDPLNAVVSEFDVDKESEILQSCLDVFNHQMLNYVDPSTGYVYKYNLSDYYIYADLAANEILPVNDNNIEDIVLPDLPVVYTGGGENIPNRPMFLIKNVSSLYQKNTNAGILGMMNLNINPGTATAYYWGCPVGLTKKGSSPSICNANGPNKPGNPFAGIFSTIDGEYCFENQCSPATVLEGEMVYPGCGYVNDGVMTYE